MSDNNDLFFDFTALEPSDSASSEAIERTRVAILEAADESRSARASKNRFRRPRLAVAAVLLVLAGMAWMLILGDRSVMAGIIRQMVRSKSVRCVVESRASLQDERLVKSLEILYDRYRGFSERSFDVVSQQPNRVEIDNFKQNWTQSGNSKTVAIRRPQNVHANFDKLFNPLGTVGKSNSLLPAPEKDQSISGIPCRCFVLPREAKRVDGSPGPEQSMFLWIDQDERLRRMTEEVKLNDKWVLVQRANVQYDIEFDDDAFEPNFAADVQMVDVDELMDEMFALEDALHRVEHKGYDVAVHDLKRIDDYRYTLVASFRPTQATLDKLNLARGEVPGDMHGWMRNSVQMKPHYETESEFSHNLAAARINGVIVRGFVITYRGTPKRPLERARPAFRVFPHHRLWSEVGSNSDVTMDMPLPDVKTPFRDAMRSMYDTIANLELTSKTSYSDELYLRDELYNRVSVRTDGWGVQIHTEGTPLPSEIDFETFFEHINASPQFGNPTKSTTTATNEEE